MVSSESETVYSVTFSLYGQLGFCEAGGMSGEETTNKLHEIDVNVRFVDYGGYAKNSVMNDCVTYGFEATVKKPVQMKKLIEVIGDSV